ncbi:MAG: hypothetical protein H7222_08080 [Methylotenera sp.]|nr:hypothetical protein [Oligoflexia bacterium]
MKKPLNFTLLSALAALSCSQPALAKSEETGVVLKICGSEVELLESYEARLLERPAADFGEAPSDFQEALKLPLTRLARLDPDRAALYRKGAEGLMGSVLDIQTLPDAPSVSTLTMIPLPPGCSLKPLTQRRAPLDLGEKIIFMDLPLWQSLTPKLQAEAALHLLAEADLATAEVDSPASIRFLTEMLAAGDLTSRTFKQYVQFWKTIAPSKSVFFQIQGLRLVWNSLKFDDQGNLQTAIVASDSEWKTVDSAGNPTTGNLSEASNLQFKDSRLQEADFKGLELDLISPAGKQNLKMFGITRFFPNGNLLSSSLAHETSFKIGNCTVTFPGKTAVQFSAAGVLEKVEVPEDSPRNWTFCNVEGETTVFRKLSPEARQIFEFYVNGQIKTAAVAEDHSYLMFDGPVIFTRLTPITFYPDGKIKRGQVKTGFEPIHLTTVSGRKKSYLWLPTLTFSPEGKVLGEF